MRSFFLKVEYVCLTGRFSGFNRERHNEQSRAFLLRLSDFCHQWLQARIDKQLGFSHKLAAFIR